MLVRGAYHCLKGLGKEGREVRLPSALNLSQLSDLGLYGWAPYSGEASWVVVERLHHKQSKF